MGSNLATLADVQLHRAAALPAKVADNPARPWWLESLQRRNAFLDALFYNIANIREEERPELAFWLAREGSIILVPPSGGAKLRLCLDREDFFRAGGAEAAALAVAGVGSSALGAAAFARDVADAIGAPVAAIVSGYGLADAVTEGMGGFFWFGALNGIRHAFEGLDRIARGFSAIERSIEAADGVRSLGLSEDTAAIIALLEDKRSRFDLLAGHSKGNLVISEALYAIDADRPRLAAALARRCRIVTISARIGMPPRFHRVIDVMGEWDTFGALNSRPDIPADYVVPNAWHSTSHEFPFGMGIDVTKVLKTALPMFQGTPPRPRAARVSGIVDLPQLLAAARWLG